VTQKRAMIEMDHPGLSISRQCELLGLCRASYYRTPGMETEKNQELMRLIDEEYTRHPFLGSRGMKRYLRRQGHKVNRKRVQRLMRLMGVVSIAPRKRMTVPAPGHKIYPYLLRGLDIDRPGQVWCSDLTYIRLNRGFVFLTAVMDWHSRYVLSWEVSVTMDEGFCVSSLERALRQHPHPEIFNTDQGSQYTGAAFTGVLKDQKVKISMDGKGRATDNIMVERLWRTVKYEDVYLKDYETVEDLIAGLRTYFSYYNYERSHQSLGDKTPAEIYWGRESLKRAA
jgi:putative transposase